MELGQSETQYVVDLQTIVERLVPGIRERDLLDEDTMGKLFLNMEQILQLNLKFSLELDSRIFYTIY
jgi:hypothetical protein